MIAERKRFSRVFFCLRIFLEVKESFVKGVNDSRWVEWLELYHAIYIIEKENTFFRRNNKKNIESPSKPWILCLKNVCTTDLWLFNLKYKYIFKRDGKVHGHGTIVVCWKNQKIVFSIWETVMNVKQWT